MISEIADAAEEAARKKDWKTVYDMPKRFKKKNKPELPCKGREWNPFHKFRGPNEKMKGASQ